MKEKFENTVDENTILIHKRLEELIKYENHILLYPSKGIRIEKSFKIRSKKINLAPNLSKFWLKNRYDLSF